MTSSPFDALLDAAADLASRLHKLESSPKLSAKSFLKTARLYAGVSRNRLDRLRAKIDVAVGGDSVRAFIRRLGNELHKDRWPEPPMPAKFERIGRVFGDEKLPGELAALRIDLGTAIAIGCAAAIERHPHAFGEVTDLAGHKREVETLRRDLAALYEKISVGFGAADLIVRHQELESNYRAAGLVKAIFKRAPSVIPGRPNWPVELVAHVAAERDAERLAVAEAKARKKERAKRKRERAEQRASA